MPSPKYKVSIFANVWLSWRHMIHAFHKSKKACKVKISPINRISNTNNAPLIMINQWILLPKIVIATWLKTNRKIAKTKYRYLGEPYRDDNANQKWFQIWVVLTSPSKTLLELEPKPLRHSHQYPRIKFYFIFHHKGLSAGLQSGVITSTVFVHYRNYGKLNSTQWLTPN